MLGPIMLGGIIVGLTLAQYDFMRGLRWHPLYAPTTDWPSGLALGPYGLLMVAAFIGAGLLLPIFALGLHRVLGASSLWRGGSGFLVLSGFAMMLLGFKIDPTYVDPRRTILGMVHDLAFALLGLLFTLALVMLWRQFARLPGWQGHARYTLLTALLVVPAFALKGLLFYLFLANTLAWIELTAIRLWRSQPKNVAL
jgi:hypothetical protein